MSQLAAKHLSFTFHAEPVLEDVNLRCGAGRFVSILGASGCGKSTFLRLAAGLLQPTSGEITINGDPAKAVGNVGFVFQKPTLCAWRDVTGNIELPLQLRHRDSQTRRSLAHEALQLVGLGAADARKLPKQLSGGMQMRVSLARALVTKPQVMLMDEPFSALDEILRQQLCETYLKLWRHESWTTVFVTHNVTEAVFMSERIYILSGKPATIVDVIDVPFSTRDTELRTSVEFVRFVSETSQRLRDAVEMRAPQ